MNLTPTEIQLLHALADKEVSQVIVFQENHELPEGFTLDNYLETVRELREKLEDILKEEVRI